MSATPAMNIKQVLQQVNGVLTYDNQGGVHVDVLKAVGVCVAAGLISAGPFGIAAEAFQLLKLLQGANIAPTVTLHGVPGQTNDVAYTFQTGGSNNK